MREYADMNRNLSKEIISLREKGESVRKIAKILSIAVSTSSYWCKKCEIHEKIKQNHNKALIENRKIKEELISKKRLDRKFKRVIGPHPFNEHYVYGPIFHKRIDRNMIYLVKIKDSSKRSSMSYARYLMSIHLKRKLSKREQVDHINGNRRDDRIENLQILTQLENNRKAVIEQKRTRVMVELICPTCSKRFFRERRKTHLAKKSSFLGFCSRKCAWSYDRSNGVFSGNVVRIFKA